MGIGRVKVGQDRSGQDRGQYESQGRNPLKEIQNGGPVFLFKFAY